jgi:soluble lytic murein transglycosylase-like protein
MKLKLYLSLVLVTILTIIWFAAEKIAVNRLVNLEKNGQIVYGPLPNHTLDFYSFNSIEKAFDPKLNLALSDKFSKEEFEKLILDSLPIQARENFKIYVKETLQLSEEYQVDPLWIISIMMVESGFELKSMSNKNARGLMQIRPETADHLQQLMGRRSSKNASSERYFHSDNNIDVGIFYLKKLFQNFHLNYSMATIAYNLGPNKLKNYLEIKKDLSRYSYLLKVQESYKLIENNLLLEFNARLRDTSQNLANIPYRNEFFTNSPVQSKFFL